MHAIEMLLQEHRTIERVVEALEAAAAHLGRGAPVRPAFFIEAADFFTDYADGLHHRKEEDVLFGAINASGMPSDDGPIPMMLEEHVQARALTRALRDAGHSLEAKESGAEARVATHARNYAALIRDHIAKEDEVLFPMVAEMLAGEVADRVLADFIRLEREDVGAGRAEALLSLAERLAREAAEL